MTFTLGSIIVKGGKIISSGHNHQRYVKPEILRNQTIWSLILYISPKYDGLFNSHTHSTPVSMHAEMHAIFNVTGGRSPSFKQQVQPQRREALRLRTKLSGGRARAKREKAESTRAEALRSRPSKNSKQVVASLAQAELCFKLCLWPAIPSLSKSQHSMEARRH